MKIVLIFAMIVIGTLVGAGIVTAETYESDERFTFPGDWAEVPTTEVTLFYPGQASWQFLSSPQHPGSSGLLAGTGCNTCHRGTETTLGEKLVAHPDLEPAPIEGKKPAVDVEMKAAYDSDYIYLRFEWDAEWPGIVHDLLRWDGTNWVTWGGPKPDAANPSYEDRLTVILSDRDIPAFEGANIGFTGAGCFITCHDSMRAMPREPTADEVRANPYIGDAGLGQSDVRKYLLTTRTEVNEAGGWDKVKTGDEVSELKDGGNFLDMWMWRGARGGPIGYADDNYVLEYRLGDEGTGAFLTQNQPEWMYDQAIVGFNAIPEAKFEELGEFLELPALIRDVNAVPFDPAASFNVGDLLPRRVLREPSGSVADILANSKWENGRWVLEMRRSLNTGNPDDKMLETGRVYDIGLAIFDDKVSNRRHYVSLPLTLGIGVDANVRAVVSPTPAVPTTTPTDTEPPSTPGFEAVFALAGLLAIAYMVRRHRL